MSANHRLAPLSLAALGVVFGDIGTSPIYALRECFFGEHSVPPSPGNVLGVLSLITWSLILVISIKYLVVVMRADNRGEGGTIALLALLNPWRARRGSVRYWLMLLGLIGAALLYGDGTITPAISVLSAVEGLEVATPAMSRFVVPATMVILTGLFLLQRHGTTGLGRIFGPAMAIWFVVLAALGVNGIIDHPRVLLALNPLFGLEFLGREGITSFTILGSVFLVVTGGEALYADMGHFGRKPIRLVWFALVLPALLMNYYGQAALVLDAPTEATNPFYHLAPDWATYPLVGLATVATVIASQAMITGAFSVTSQLVQLGQLPRMEIIQTSSDERGQIYIPVVNWLIAAGSLALVLAFKSSSALASAYGIAVCTTMVTTTVLAFFVARRFDWNPIAAIGFGGLFAVIDLSFFASNVAKVADGGWVPMVMGAAIFALMTTWARGRQLFQKRIADGEETTTEFARLIAAEPPHRIPGTGIFLTGGDHAPAYLLRHLERNRVLNERIILLTVQTIEEPYVPAIERLRAWSVAPGLHRLVIRYGFMQTPNVPVALRLTGQLGLDIDIESVTYYLGRATLIPSDKLPGMALWRDHLFSYLAHNAARATDFYRLPPEDVVELGFHVEI